MRWLFRIIFIVVAVLGLVIGALLLLPGEKLAQIAADQIRAETGREVTFQGDVKVTFWPVLGLETGPVTVANATWSKSGPMLSADALSVGVSAPNLLAGAIRVKKVLATRPILRLDVQGEKANWDLSQPEPVASSAAGSSDGSGAGSDEAGSDFSLEKLVLTDAQLIYTRDEKVELNRAGVDMTASWPEADGPLDLELELSLGGDPLAIAAELANPQILGEGGASPVTLSIRSAAGTVGFDGRFSREGDVEGKLKVDSSDTARLLAAFGQSGFDVPHGFGRSVKIQGNATYTHDGRLSLRKMVLGLDGNQLNGAADVVLAAKPQINANLTATTLDFSKLAESGTASSGGGGGAVSSDKTTGWSNKPIDAAPLGLVDGTITLAAQSVKLPDFDLGETQVVLQIERSRAVLRLKQVSVFSGSLNGQLVANNRSGLSVGGDLSVKDINLNQALTALVDVTRFSGKASGNLKFLGSGQTENQIMHALSGSGSLSMGQGVINGFDLHRLMDGHTRTGGTTVFNSLTASFTMANGDLDNKDLLLKLDHYRADGKGRIGIGARDIDYLFTPVLLRANSGRGREVPIRIVGPWADPSIKPDLKKVLEAAAEAELDKVGDTAKKALHGKLGEELDAPIESTEDVEKALKNKLEEEAKKGLLKLFGGD
ncbi:MAG: AsmA family protein [Paracoccaceae bacterium]